MFCILAYEIQILELYVFMANLNPLEFLFQLESKGINLDLGPVARLLQRLDNPHKKYPTVHIGGSNGKGSVAAMISSMLHEAGFTVGLYTSPHISDFRERIRVNTLMISSEELCEFIELIRNEITEDITYFEFATVLAFLYFERCKVDIAVLEVGMGGRLDATNVVVPHVSVITNVSLEHTAYLGRSLKSIAGEKGGIVKREGVCVTAAKQRIVRSVLEKICGELNARLYRAGRDMRLRKSGHDTFSYYGIYNDYHNLSVALVGNHQKENAVLALGAVDVLTEKGFTINTDAVAKGLKNVRWEGRLEVLRKKPLLLTDGAHNPAGAAALSRSLTTDFSYEKLILIFGVLKDKDYRAMLRILAQLADVVIVTKPDSERALDPQVLTAPARRYTDRLWCIENVRDALDKAFSLAGDDDVICVTGSLYLVGAAKRLFPKLDL